VNQGFGSGHVATTVAWLTYAANVIVTAMVAVSFGSYAASALRTEDPLVAKAMAIAIVVAMTALNVAGSTLVARVQSLIVFVVVGILAFFALVTIANIDTALLSPSLYPGPQDIVSSVALTFFAFLGFGVVTFTAKDLRDPSRQLPRAMAIAIGLATIVYVAVSLGVFGTLSVQEVIDAGPTAIAVAAQPVLGDAGYWLMVITALFATSGATNAGLYPASGLSEHLASTGQFPPFMATRLSGGRLPMGLLVAAVAIVVLVAFFDLNAIASIGSAVALLIFTIVSLGHLRIRADTGARTVMLMLAVATAGITLLTFVLTTLIHEPASMVTLVVIIGGSVALDLVWSARRGAPEPGG
jgi:amino acid transporter